MSSYQDDALVPIGARVPARPGVTLIPAPTVVQPQPGPSAAAPTPTIAASVNPTQPAPAAGPAVAPDQGDVLVPQGARVLTRPGFTYLGAPRSATSTSAGSSASGPMPPVASPGGRSPSQPTPGQFAPQNVVLGGGPTRGLAGLGASPVEGAPESTGRVIELHDTLRNISDMFEAKDSLDPQFVRWVQAHWNGAPFTASQLKLATDIVLSHQETSWHGKLVGYGGALGALLSAGLRATKADRCR